MDMDTTPQQALLLAYDALDALFRLYGRDRVRPYEHEHIAWRQARAALEQTRPLIHRQPAVHLHDPAQNHAQDFTAKLASGSPQGS